MSPKIGFLNLPGELRNKIYSLLTPCAVCDIADTERIQRNIIAHPITSAHKIIAAEWSSIAFHNITFFVRPSFERRGRFSLKGNPTRGKDEKNWDDWLRLLNTSQVTSIERIIFYMQDFKVDINLTGRKTVGDREGRRCINFKVSGCANHHALNRHFLHCFSTIEDEDGTVGKQELTWIRDDVFDAQESFQSFMNRR